MNFELSVASKLLAVGLIELDEHDDVLFSWQYPDIEDSLRELITGISHIKKVNLKYFFVFMKHWKNHTYSFDVDKWSRILIYKISRYICLYFKYNRWLWKYKIKWIKKILYYSKHNSKTIFSKHFHFCCFYRRN